MQPYAYVMPQLVHCYRNSHSLMVVMVVGFVTIPVNRVKGSGSVQIYPLDNIHACRTHHESKKYAEEATALGKPVKGLKGASTSILLLLPQFHIVQSVVPEYVHCVLIGVVRKVLNLSQPVILH